MRISIFFLIWIFVQPRAFAQDIDGCGNLQNPFGPFDYTDPENAKVQTGQNESRLMLVERAHFTGRVEALTAGHSSVDPYDDLEYTLRAFPNHHRALYAMGRYYLENGPQPAYRLSGDCWFKRAIRFRAADPTVRLIYGIILSKKNDNAAAMEQYKTAIQIDKDFAEAHYNIGLLYVELEDYESARNHAIRAYELGYPLPGLKNRLIRIGQWPEENRN